MGGQLSPLILLLLLLVGIFTISTSAWTHSRRTRSIELSAANSLIADTRLSNSIVPQSYTLNIRPNIQESNFTGNVKINIKCIKETQLIALHAQHDLEINESNIHIKPLNAINNDDSKSLLSIRRTGRIPKKQIYEIYLTDSVQSGKDYEIEISFTGNIWESPEGLFKGTFLSEHGEKKIYLATHMRPHYARRLFPCFDEPGIKTTFNVTISRPKTYTTIFNMKIQNTTEM